MENKNEYSFLKEKIKDKPFNWKHLWQKACLIAGAGILFGICACIAFCGLKPWAEKRFENSPQKVVVPPDDEEENLQNQEEEEQEDKTAVLDINNVRELNRAVYDVSRTASKSVAQVTVRPAGDEWLDESYQAAAGIVLADNGREILVLTEGILFGNSEETITVTLPDDKEYEAVLKKKDDNLGLAVVGISKTLLSDTVWTYTNFAVYGNSNLLGRGDGLIALGRPFGTKDGLAYGVVSSTQSQICKADGMCRILESDIGANENSSAILFNVNGEFVGITCQAADETSRSNLIAYPISEIKSQIELLLNGSGVPYVGIRGEDIPKAVQETKQIPMGVYVKEVEADSPAMQSGIQSGDIIVSVDGDKIQTLASYKTKILTYRTDAKIRIGVKRAGADGYVDITYEVTVASKE